MDKRIALGALGALGAIVAIIAAYAALAAPTRCGGTEDVEKGLVERFGEIEAWNGVTADNRLAQLFLSPDGEDWTFVVRTPQRISCMVMHGRGWVLALPKYRSPI